MPCHILRALSAATATVFAVVVGGPATAAERTATPTASIRVADGFTVELVRSAQDGEDSWISMAFDERGRVVVGLDEVGVARLAPPDAAGGGWSFTRLDDTLRHCRGVLVHAGAIYVNATDSKELWRFRDPDGDGRYRDRRLLHAFDYRSRYGHGQNQLTVGPDGAIYSIVGNDVAFPAGVSPRSPYRGQRLDRLLVDPADAHEDDRVGYLLRFDPEGTEWTVVAGGFRNQVDAAWNPDGEWFTWDADMEWDVGQPWYRPTRLNHVVPGAEYGWRWGTSKWPPSYPDSTPATLETGLGSPTGLVFGTRSSFPGRWREALFMADWQHGRILAVWLTPRGASYTAVDELFAEGAPLNVCDMAIGPDGCQRNITAGRPSQSGLNRVSFSGDSARVAQAGALDPAVAETAREARRRRHALEAFHAGPVAGAEAATVADLWPDLASDDRWLRTAARVALERQPLAFWRERAMRERHPLARAEAVLAWSRMAEEGERSQVVDAVLAGSAELARADTPAVLLRLRALAILLARGTALDPERRHGVHSLLDTLAGAEHTDVGREVVELLVATGHPQALERVLERLDGAASQEEEIHCVHAVVRWRGPWTVAAHRRLLAWFARAATLRGGHLLPKIVARMRADLLATIADDERPAMALELAALEQPPAATGEARAAIERPVVRRWTLEDLLPGVNRALGEARDPAAGRRALAAAQCLTCHRFGPSGSAVGPDLSAVGGRFDTRAILESILEPSKVVDAKYHSTTWVLTDGRTVTGRAGMVTGREIGVETDPLAGTLVKILRDEIESTHPSAVSPMPTGLLDTLTSDEVADLVAALVRGAGAR
ncbi:MAG: hypothetical protein ACKOTB_18545 [Planctomycetia bacterium]